MQNDSRNLMIFLGFGLAIFLFYQYFVIGPKQEQIRRQQAAAAAQAPAPGQPVTPVAAAPTNLTLPQALARSPRVAIETPTMTGSIALMGARIDQLSLNRYRQTMEANAPAVELLRPDGATNAYFAEFTWTGQNLPGLPTAETVWTAPAGAKLTPTTPVVLTYQSPQGLVFTRTISVDNDSMFSVSDTVANYSAAPVTLVAGGAVVRRGLPVDPVTHAPLGSNQIVHEGAIGVMQGQLRQLKYSEWKKKVAQSFGAGAPGGWFGITDKYWMTALAPDQGEPLNVAFTYRAGTTPSYEVRYSGNAYIIAPNMQVTHVLNLFAGAKTVPLLERYQREGAPQAPTVGGRPASSKVLPNFHSGVDWGNFWVITRPMFLLLEQLFRWFGNFGLAILGLTVVVKVVFFPLANKSYESLTKMKKVQPELEALRAKFKDDPAEQQREMMALYQREKVNPFMGCIPMLLQIPVFYGLYKVLTVTIEMRHASFFGWVNDLSARESQSIWTLFGLIDWAPASVPFIGPVLNGQLHIGFLAMFYGFTMWLSQAMSPQQGMDPMQKRIFAFMPFILVFTLAQVAVGLLIYWIWSNFLSILQQYVIMRRFKVENPIDTFLARFAKPKAEAG